MLLVIPWAGGQGALTYVPGERLLKGRDPRARLSALQVRDFLMRVKSQRFPTIEKDLKMVLAHCGSLFLDPAALSEVCPPALHAGLQPGCDRPSEMAGLPRFRARACQGAPHKSNVEVIQSTGALLRMPGGPRHGFPDFQGRACAPQGDAGAVIPCFQPWLCLEDRTHPRQPAGAISCCSGWAVSRQGQA